MEPPSPIHGLRASQPFPSRFINRTHENREMRVLSYVKQQAASAFMRLNALQKKMVLFINLLGKGLTKNVTQP